MSNTTPSLLLAASSGSKKSRQMQCWGICVLWKCLLLKMSDEREHRGATLIKTLLKHPKLPKRCISLNRILQPHSKCNSCHPKFLMALSFSLAVCNTAQVVAFATYKSVHPFLQWKVVLQKRVQRESFILPYNDSFVLCGCCGFHIMSWFVIRETIFHLESRQSHMFEWLAWLKSVSVEAQPTHHIANESDLKTAMENPEQSWH